MPDWLHSAEGLGAFFEETAGAVARAQGRLDGGLGRDFLARHAPRGQGVLYSIPRVGVELVFGLRVESRKKVFIFLTRGSRKELHEHRLSFDLVATPEPPPPLSAAPAALPFYLTEPHFMLPPGEETLRFAQLVAALADPARRLSLLPPSAGGLKPEKLEREVNRLVRAFINDGGDASGLLKAAPEGGDVLKQIVEKAVEDASDDDANRERGLVYFRLDTAPASYLIARVTKKSENDSLFVLTPEGPGGVTRADIYSIEDDKTPSVRYRPLHLLGLTLRHWLEGARPLFVKVEGEDWPRLVAGLENLAAFAENLREGYARGVAALASKPGGEPGAAYDLAGVLAELSYTVDYDRKDDGGETTNPHLNFEQKAGGGEDNVFIQSRAFVRVARAGASARVEVALAAPEFALSGKARERFLRFFFPFRAGGPARRIILDMRGKLGAREAERYEGFIAEEDYRRGVVVLLSYKGNRPKNQFLVIWPGTNRAGSPKSFAFTCEPAGKGDELKLTRWVLGVDEGLDEVTLDTSARAGDDEDGADDKNLSEEQYQVFHNFFHAVRIWRSRVRKT